MFVPGDTFQFESKAGAYSSGAPLKNSTQILDIPAKNEARLENLAGDKHSSLLRRFVKYGLKMFYNLGSLAENYKIS